MGLFDRLFPKPARYIDNGYWKTLNGYSPIYTSRAGSAYESELVRAAIDSRARHIAKLKIEFRGTAKSGVATKLTNKPNEFMTWYKFLYRLSTILDMQNTAFIVPVYDDYGRIEGIYPILPSRATIEEDAKGNAWLKYTFNNGKTAAIELLACGVLTKFQYEDDIFGGTQTALTSTLDLIDMQKKGISEAIKAGASYKFMAKVNNFAKDTDLAKERKRFNRENFEHEDDGGAFLLLPNTYTDIKQIDLKPYTVPKDELELIQTNVFNYYGTNLEVIQNRADGNAMDAFFNGAIEPFSILLSEVITQMLYTANEIYRGNQVLFSANRLQYMSTGTKIQMVQQLADRGMLLIDEGRELFNLPPLPDGAGQTVPIRGEYHMVVGDDPQEQEEDENNEQ